MGAVPFVAAGLLIIIFGMVLVLRPSVYLNLRHVRDTYNPKLLSSPYFRVQMRGLGLVFSLFGFVFAASIIQKIAVAPYLLSLEQTLYAALMVVFFALWVGAVLTWILEKVRLIKPSLKERYDSVTPEQDTIRQHKEAVAFASILGAVLFASVLAVLLK